MDLLLGLIAGAVGGVLTGGVLRSLCLHRIGNTLAGMAGGGLAAWLSSQSGGFSGTVPAMLATGAAGGALVCAILGVIRNVLLR